MFSLIFKFTFRNFWRQRFYHLITITGLSLAFAAAFFILVWVNHELSYDRYNPEHHRLYRLSYSYQFEDRHSHFARTANDWVLYLKDYFPEIEEVIRLAPMRNTSVRIGESKFYTTHFFNADSSVFRVFGLNLLSGDPDRVLTSPRTVVISESIARKYFGTEDPVGQTIYSGHQFDTAQHLFTVTGVMEDTPVNSHFHFDILGSIDDPKEHIGWSYNYLLLHEGSREGDMLAKFPDFLKEHLPEERIGDYAPVMQLVSDIHLHSAKDREIEPNGKALYVIIFIIVACLLLGIAFINYANLQLAAINKKLGFIHLNRIVGARIRDVLKFISFESFINSFLSVLAGILLLVAGIPAFNRFFGYQLNLDQTLIWIQIAFLGIILLGTGSFLGSYPVLLLRIKERLSQLSGRIFYHKGFNLIQEKRGVGSRTVMVIFQFLVSIILIFSTIIIYLQVEYMLGAGIGSGDRSILVMKNLPRQLVAKYSVYKEELMGNPLVREVSASMEEPSADVLDAMRYEIIGKDDQNGSPFLAVMPCDHTFLEFYDIPLLAGRNFPEYQGMEAREHYILNESAVRSMGFKSPEDAIGQPFRLLFQYQDIFVGGEIIGVSEDFHFHSLARPVRPMVMFQKHIWFDNFLIRIDDERFSEALEYVGDTWNRIFPEYPFEYDFVDDLYGRLYKNEITQARVLVVFTILTILIACLGLIGLMSYLTETRTKEIGIRKVNGASTFRILYLLGRKFILWICIAILIAAPASRLGIDRWWLQNFVFRIDMDWWIFIVAGLLVLLLASVAITIQALKAASRDPADSLRYE